MHGAVLVAHCRTNVEKAALKVPSAEGFVNAAQTELQCAMDSLSHKADEIRDAIAMTRELSALTEGSLEALGPSMTSRMLSTLSQLNQILSGVGTAYVDVRKKCLEASAAFLSLTRAVQEVDRNRKELAEALTTTLRTTAHNCDALEMLVSWCRGYVANVVAERVAWQERNGLNPAMLTHATFLSELALKAAEAKLPPDTLLRADEDPLSAVQRFICRIDRSQPAQYVTPREELALLRQLLRSSGSLIPEANTGRRTTRNIAFDLKFKADLLRSQLDNIREAVSDWRSQFITELCIVNEGLERKAKSLEKQTHDVESQTEVTKQKPGMALSAGGRRPPSSPRSSMQPSPRATNEASLLAPPSRASQSPSEDGLKPLGEASATPPNTNLIDAADELPQSSASVSVFVPAPLVRPKSLLGHGSAPLEAPQKSDSKIGTSVPEALPAVPRFATRPSEAQSALNRLDAKVQRALALADTLEATQKDLPKPREVLGLAALEPQRPTAPSSAPTARRPGSQQLAAMRIDRAEFDRWLQNRFGHQM